MSDDIPYANNVPYGDIPYADFADDVPTVMPIRAPPSISRDYVIRCILATKASVRYGLTYPFLDMQTDISLRDIAIACRAKRV